MRMGSQAPSFCCQYWGTHCPQEKKHTRLQLHPRGWQAAAWGSMELCPVLHEGGGAGRGERSRADATAAVKQGWQVG